MCNGAASYVEGTICPLALPTESASLYGRKGFLCHKQLFGCHDATELVAKAKG
jgi:hypothetical protein